MAKKQKYVATPGAMFDPKKAQVIGEAIADLGEGITPDGLVSAAENDPVLHDLFEWDDTVAARRYRMTQARHVLNHISVVV